MIRLNIHNSKISSLFLLKKKKKNVGSNVYKVYNIDNLNLEIIVIQKKPSRRKMSY